MDFLEVMYFIALNIAIKQPVGLEVEKFFPRRSQSWKNCGTLESFSVGKIGENPARIFCLNPVMSSEGFSPRACKAWQEILKEFRRVVRRHFY